MGYMNMHMHMHVSKQMLDCAMYSDETSVCVDSCILGS